MDKIESPVPRTLSKFESTKGIPGPKRQQNPVDIQVDDMLVQWGVQSMTATKRQAIPFP